MGQERHCSQPSPKMNGFWSSSQRTHLILLVVLLMVCPISDATSIVQLQSGVPVRGQLQSGGNGMQAQHYYSLNVSSLIGRTEADTGAVARRKLTVTLAGDIVGKSPPMVLSLCRDQLPCGNLGCSCPSDYIDNGSRGGRNYPARSVEVSACDLVEGIWYVSVELLEPDRPSNIAVESPYILTADLSNAALPIGSTVQFSICCKQSQYYYVDLKELAVNNELTIKLVSDDRLREQGPLRLSASYTPCADDDARYQHAAGMDQVLTLPPGEVSAGRIFVGVHSVEPSPARFMLSVYYRPELKWTVVAFLVTMVVLVIATIGVVCVIKIRRRIRKYKEFDSQLKLRKASVGQSMSVRSRPASEAGASTEEGGKINFSDSEQSDEEVPLRPSSNWFHLS